MESSHPSSVSRQWWDARDIEMNILENVLHAWELVKKEEWMDVLPSTWAFNSSNIPIVLQRNSKLCFVFAVIDRTWALLWDVVSCDSMDYCAHYDNSCRQSAPCHHPSRHLGCLCTCWTCPWWAHLCSSNSWFLLCQNIALKLKWSVYDFKQAPCYFFNSIKDCLESKEPGLMQSSWEPCLFLDTM